MYVPAVCILTSIVNLLLMFDLSLTPLDIFWPPETIWLSIHWLLTHPSLETISMLQLCDFPTVHWEHIYLHITQNTWTTIESRRSAWAEAPVQNPRIQKLWDPIYISGSIEAWLVTPAATLIWLAVQHMRHNTVVEVSQLCRAPYLINIIKSNPIDILHALWLKKTSHLTLSLTTVCVTKFQQVKNQEIWEYYSSLDIDSNA